MRVPALLVHLAAVAGGAPAIVAENALRGTPERVWDVNGDGAGNEIEGFTTAASVLPAERVEFKISVRTARRESFRVDVYRLGYYGGAGARLQGRAELVDEDAARAQPSCEETEPSARLVDCGNWAVVAAWDVPAGAVSGLYFARLTLDGSPSTWRADASRIKYDPIHAQAGADPSLPPDGSLPHAYGAAGHNRLRNALTEPRASHAWFVVRSAARHGLLFQTTDLTWHAYNGYGGYTTYGTFQYPYEHAPGRAPLNISAPGHQLVRAHKRSYNTPLITREYRAVNAPLGAEYAAIRWLERNGYDVHYATGADLSVPRRAADILSRSAAYVSVGHDEYWSYEQREAVEAARDAGVHLNFWSGNEAYWAVRLERSAHQSGGDDEPGRTLVCYKETQSATKLDPLPGSWTGTFRDARPINPRGARPENALTGTLFAANAQRNDALRLDCARFGAHRLWRGVCPPAGSSASARVGGGEADDEEGGAVRVLYPGVLGHEWDEDIDNGVRPPALQRLSETTTDNVQTPMDHGATFDSGSATHSLVIHRRPPPRTPTAATAGHRGALVFGAGTVQWSWGLDAHHDVNDPQRQNKYSIRVGVDARGACSEVQQVTANVLSDMGVRPATPQRSLLLLPPSADETAPIGEIEVARCRLVGDAGERRAAAEMSGWAADGGGVVASVEVSWASGEWHPARIDAIGARVTWALRWGHESWHHLHASAPPCNERSGYIDGPSSALRLRLADDSGNAATLEAATIRPEILGPRDEL